MPRQRSHGVEFKRQIAQAFLGGETVHGLAKRHDLSRNLIRIWVDEYEAGALGDDARVTDMVPEYEAPPPRSIGWSAVRRSNWSF